MLDGLPLAIGEGAEPLAVADDMSCDSAVCSAIAAKCDGRQGYDRNLKR